MPHVGPRAGVCVEYPGEPDPGLSCVIFRLLLLDFCCEGPSFSECALRCCCVVVGCFLVVDAKLDVLFFVEEVCDRLHLVNFSYVLCCATFGSSVFMGTCFGSVCQYLIREMFHVKHEKVVKRKVGRPRVGSTQLGMMMPPEELAALDGWIAEQKSLFGGVDFVTRQEAIRWLVRRGIAQRFRAKWDRKF